MSNEYKDRIKDCGSFLEFLADSKLEHYKLSNGNFCGNRFCPHCAYNKSIDDATMIYSMIMGINEDNSYKYSYILLTLTAPNVSSDSLNEEIKNYYNACHLLFKYKEVKKITLGYIRKFEVTYNENTDTYHPHYHLLICVKNSYFKSRDYISRKRWLELWKKAKKDESITQLDVRKLNDKNLFKSILELSKYVAKSADYLINKKVFEVFYKSLKGKHYLEYSGIFKDYRKKFKDGLLNDYIKSDDIVYIYKVYYLWKNNDYKQDFLVKLDEDELKKYNKL